MKAKPAAHPVARRRIEKGLSAYALAKAVGTTPSHVARIERGESSPSVDLALRIATALGATVECLFPVKPEKAA